MEVSDFINEISKITNYNELNSNKDLNTIIHNKNKNEISKIINIENFNIKDIIYQMVLSAIDNENTVFLNYLIDNNIDQYFFYNDIFTSILEKDELNEKRIKFILRNEKGSLRISSSLIENLIFGEYISLLDIIFNNLKLFDNEFILNCCVCYKYKNLYPIPN